MLLLLGCNESDASSNQIDENINIYEPDIRREEDATMEHENYDWYYFFHEAVITENNYQFSEVL